MTETEVAAKILAELMHKSPAELAMGDTATDAKMAVRRAEIAWNHAEAFFAEKRKREPRSW